MATGEPRYLPMVVADRTVGLIAVQMILMALLHLIIVWQPCILKAWKQCSKHSHHPKDKTL